MRLSRGDMHARAYVWVGKLIMVGPWTYSCDILHLCLVYRPQYAYQRLENSQLYTCAHRITQILLEATTKCVLCMLVGGRGYEYYVRVL